MKVTLIIAALFASCYCKLEFSDRARNFSVELLYFTAEETQWHTVISPFGVWSLLTAASTGATKSSRKQLIKTLILPKNERTLIDGYKSLTHSVLKPGTPDVALKSKNFLFIDSDFMIKKDFMNIILKDFGTKVAKLDFKPVEEAEKNANAFIKKTKITSSNVLKPDDFENSKMILTNIISFRGLWRSPFNVTNTRVESFYDENGMEVGKVNMMFQDGSFPCSNVEEIQASVLELPYGGSETSKYSFYLLLPYHDVTIQNVYNALTKMTLKDIIERINNDTISDGMINVLVSLPRFKISTNVILNKPLNNMGITEIFEPGLASFKSITDADDVFVSSIVHKADIEVTEVGTVASAVTSMFFEDRMLPLTIKANRPFIYFVIEKTTSTIIFSGTYSKPTIF